MKEPLGGWSRCFAGCTLKIVRIFFGSGDCPAGPESSAVRRDCTEQLIEADQEFSRHRLAPDAASSASRWSRPHLARGITERVHCMLSCPEAARWRLRFLVGLSQSIRSRRLGSIEPAVLRDPAAAGPLPKKRTGSHPK